MPKDVIGRGRELAEKMKNEIEKVVFGVEREIWLLIYAFFARGHVLIEGNPGVGKTFLVNAFGRTLTGRKVKIGGRSDLVPADIAFVPYIDDGKELKFRKTRLLSDSENVVLVFLNEINRSPEKTNSIFLDAMQERSLTIFDETYPMPNAMFVGDRNPLETRQTFEIPAAQRARFMLEISLGRSEKEVRLRIIHETSRWEENPIEEMVSPDIIIAEERNEIWRWIRKNVKTSQEIADYIDELADATWFPERFNGEEDRRELLQSGLVQRDEGRLAELVRTIAALKGRTAVTVEDIHDVYKEFFSHRIFIRPVFDDVRRSQIVKEFLDEILKGVPSPCR